MTNHSRRSFIGKMGLVAGVSAMGTSLTAFKPFEGKRLNIALVGLGRYAGYLAEGIAVSEYCKVAGIVTGTPSKESIWAKKYGIDKKNIYNYENFDKIAENPDIDLVYVVLPNSMHKEFTIRAARAKKHVIVEKPMALNAIDCLEMIRECQKAGVQLAVGYRLHYEPYNMELKRLGQEKVFGQVRLVQASLGYGMYDIDPSDWHLNKELSGGGPLMNLGVYCTQASRYILGEEPISASAEFAPVIRKDLFYEVEESISWQLHFPSGAVATSTSSYNCSIDRVYAAAENGTFELSPAISYGPFKGRTSKGEFSFPTINQQQTQCDEIAKIILAGKELPNHIAGIEGYKDMRVLDAIYQSAQTGRKVKIGE